MRIPSCILSALVLSLIMNTSVAQCPGGYTKASLNWDYLDYFSYTGNYTSANYYLTSNLLSRTQNFAFGTQRLAIVHNYSDANSLGENATHTGEAGSYGDGDGNTVNDMDIQFRSNGTITVTFENAVQNVRFSIYDIDNSQAVQVTASNGILPTPVTMARVSGTSLTINALTATATASSARFDNTVTNTAINVDIAGPVTSFTIAVTNTGTCTSFCGSGGTEDGSFWISDISACINTTISPNFPSNYYNISRPFTGQPAYVLHSFDKSVYAVNPANGVTKLLFTDPAGNINSMGYDPYNRILYYVYSLTASPGTNKALKKYDFNTGTISTVLADITTIGIPVVTATAAMGSSPIYGAGVESGAAAFYNGALYLGIETGNKRLSGGLAVSNPNSLREAVIWRIDFNASNIPYRSSQVFAMPIDDGATLLHDWSDFVITNGILYDFDGAGYPTTTQTGIYHYNLLTGATTTHLSPASFAPGQPTVGWNNNLYQLHALAGATPVNPYIAPYNGNGTIGTRLTLTSTPMYTPAQPSLGDAAEGFRPLADFGDAPASYDTDPLAPAVHEIDANLRIGNAETIEWNKTSSSAANVDGADDGLTFVRILNLSGGNYQTDVNVFNNTGTNATLAAWVDFNADGVFQPGEGISQTVVTNAATQTASLFWTGVSQNLPNNSNTFLRIRITSAANGMTTANPTGYFSNGETEDYQVPVNLTPLAVNTTSFTAKKSSSDKVLVAWKATGVQPNTVYELQRSGEGRAWRTIDRKTYGSNPAVFYSYIDAHPLRPSSYYRLKYTEPDGTTYYTEAEQISFSFDNAVHVYPIPASNQVHIHLVVNEKGKAVASILDISGKVIHLENVQLEKGSNRILMPLPLVPDGFYTLRLQTLNKIYMEKLLLRRK